MLLSVVWKSLYGEKIGSFLVKALGMDPNLVKPATLNNLQTLLLVSTILLVISVAMV